MSTQVNAADVINIYINNNRIRVIPTQKLISCNILNLVNNWTTLRNVHNFRIYHIDDGSASAMYTFDFVKQAFQIKNEQLPTELHQFFYPVTTPTATKHDDFKKEAIMTTNLSTQNQSQKFHSDLFGDLTVLTHEDGSLWFIGKEVAEKLGYGNPHEAIRTHCKGVSEIRTPSKGGMQTVKIIPERDVYRLVMRSKLPTAEKFEEFVVSEILPSIRKTGSYGQVAAPVAPQAVELSRKDLLLMALKSEEEKELLQRNYDLLGTELSQAIREKSHIGSSREASVMGKLARANDKIKWQDKQIIQLEAKLSSPKTEYQYATVLAVQSRLKHIKVNGLKLTYYCNRNGLVMKDIPDDRFGVVHSYPAQAWKEVYQIDINAVLNKVV